MNTHSELKEWLAVIPSLPWHGTPSCVVDARGLVVLVVGDPSKAELKLEQFSAVADYTAHACTQLPRLLEAAREFRMMVTEVKKIWLVEECAVWNKLNDAIRDAAAEHPFPIDEQGAPTPAEILRLQKVESALRAIVSKSYLRPGKHEDCQVHPDLMETARQALGDNAEPCPECSATGQHYKTCSKSEE